MTRTSREPTLASKTMKHITNGSDSYMEFMKEEIKSLTASSDNELVQILFILAKTNAVDHGVGLHTWAIEEAAHRLSLNEDNLAKAVKMVIDAGMDNRLTTQQVSDLMDNFSEIPF